MTNEELHQKIIEALQIKQDSLILVHVPYEEVEAVSQSLGYIQKDIGERYGVTFLTLPDYIKITVIPPKSDVELL